MNDEDDFSRVQPSATTSGIWNSGRVRRHVGESTTSWRHTVGKGGTASGSSGRHVRHHHFQHRQQRSSLRREATSSCGHQRKIILKQQSD
jgi:hypothetical protein